jgi:hypothetical protein
LLNESNKDRGRMLALQPRPSVHYILPQEKAVGAEELIQ